MSDTSGLPAALRPARRWPGRPLLASRLRAILRREFGATDAWVVHTPGRCRLEARIGSRVVILLEGDEQAFWAPFYTTTVRTRYEGGGPVSVPVPTQRRRGELVELVRTLWARANAAAGPPARQEGPSRPSN
ncbi:MAG: hypothetical protein QN168_12645 [Armatimonadota bacterium]|nr:hypothetical protein [Armatimonadota bacterium]